MSIQLVGKLDHGSHVTMPDQTVALMRVTGLFAELDQSLYDGTLPQQSISVCWGSTVFKDLLKDCNHFQLKEIVPGIID